MHAGCVDLGQLILASDSAANDASHFELDEPWQDDALAASQPAR